MESGEASRTALMVAGYRARATLRGDGICDDPWAAALAGDEGLALSARFDVASPNMELWLALRTRHLDDGVRAAVERGTRQVVILGAGYDARAARLAGAAQGLRFYEVDHPATQAAKRARVSALAGYPTGAASYVPCDFERGDDFVERLEAAGYDSAADAVFIWEGVTPYLDQADIEATLARVAAGSGPGSWILFDYVGKAMRRQQRLRAEDAELLAVLDELGEPIRWGTDDPLPLLVACGFRHVRTTTFDELALSWTGTYERDRAFRFQGIALASRTAPAGFWT